MLVGALWWGLSADIIGRRFAFNCSLMISSIFAIVAGASPDWIVLGLFICLAAFGAGGNLVLDTAVFLEYLPSQKQWLLTLMAMWWGKIHLPACVKIARAEILRHWAADCWSLRLGLPPKLQRLRWD